MLVAGICFSAAQLSFSSLQAMLQFLPAYFFFLQKTRFGEVSVTFILLVVFLEPLPWLVLWLRTLKATFCMKRKAGM